MVILLLLLLSNFQARANDLALPENFFKKGEIRYAPLVKIDLCTRVKNGKQVLVINQWEGSNQKPAVESAALSKKSKKKKRVRSKKRNPQLKSQMEIESTLAQLIANKTIDTLVMEDCSFPLATKFKERTTLMCETTVTNRLDFLADSIKKSTSEKPILAIYEEQYSDDIMKRLEAEKWNCEIYEPKSFKVKKAKRKPHTPETIESDDHED